MIGWMSSFASGQQNSQEIDPWNMLSNLFHEILKPHSSQRHHAGYAVLVFLSYGDNESLQITALKTLQQMQNAPQDIHLSQGIIFLNDNCCHKCSYPHFA